MDSTLPYTVILQVFGGSVKNHRPWALGQYSLEALNYGLVGEVPSSSKWYGIDPLNWVTALKVLITIFVHIYII